MGGWIALLCARALAEAGETDRLHALVLIAPAADFTEALIFARLARKRAAGSRAKVCGCALRFYSPDPYPITRALIEDGRRHIFSAAPSIAIVPCISCKACRIPTCPGSMP